MTLKKLTTKQKALLKKHSDHHSKKHISSMRMNMMLGKTFNEAHNIAQKKVGK
tara:strand:+ start:441 stop:599 length:159 start_codon:yes stop_codon:yes gene_type:complete